MTDEGAGGGLVKARQGQTRLLACSIQFTRQAHHFPFSRPYGQSLSSKAKQVVKARPLIVLDILPI